MTPVEEAPQEGLLNDAKLRKRQRKKEKKKKEKVVDCLARRPAPPRQLCKSQGGEEKKYKKIHT
jgi:hypothetical protein